MLAEAKNGHKYMLEQVSAYASGLEQSEAQFAVTETEDELEKQIQHMQTQIDSHQQQITMLEARLRHVPETRVWFGMFPVLFLRV